MSLGEKSSRISMENGIVSLLGCIAYLCTFMQVSLNYKTGKLPFNFTALGVLLLAVSIWRMAVSDWVGILFLLVSLFLLFFRSGVLIDPKDKRVKKYVGIFGIRKGKWKKIDSLMNLEIIKTQEAQTMSVLSVSRTESYHIYKLYMNFPDHKTELLSGKKEDISRKAEDISILLQTTVTDFTN